SNFLARKFKETSFLRILTVQVFGLARHLHLSVIRVVKEQCCVAFRLRRQLRRRTIAKPASRVNTRQRTFQHQSGKSLISQPPQRQEK
ncbi:hypothetical protein, partial [Vogesella indigofera]